MDADDNIIYSLKKLFKYAFLGSQAKNNEYPMILNTINCATNNFADNLIYESDFIEDNFATILRWGIKENVMNKFKSDPDLISEFVLVLSNFALLHSSNKRIILMNRTIESIAFILDNLNSEILTIKEPSFLKKPQSIILNSNSMVLGTLFLLLEFLNNSLLLFPINTTGILDIIYYLIRQEDPKLYHIGLKILSNYIPYLISDYYAVARLTFLFFNIHTDIDRSMIEETDRQLTKAYKRAVSKLRNCDIFPIVREIITIISCTESYIFPMFVDEFLLTIINYTKYDSTSFNFFADLFVRKFGVFKESKSYKEMCKKIAKRDEKRSQQFINLYMKSIQTIPYLMDIIPSFLVSSDDLASFPADLLIEASLHCKELSETIIEKLVFFMKRKQISLENLTKLSKYLVRPIMNNVSLFNGNELVLIFHDNVDILDSYIDYWQDVDKSVTNPIPFICTLAKRAFKKNHPQLKKILLACKKYKNTLETWNNSEYRDIVHFIFSDDELMTMFKALVDSLTVKEISAELASFFLNDPLMSNYFFKKLMLVFKDYRDYIEQIYAYKILKDNQENLISVYYKDRFANAEILLDAMKENRATKIVFTLIFNKLDFQIMCKEIIPVFVSNCDLESLEFIAAEYSDSVENLVHKVTSEIYSYIFSHKSNASIQKIIKFISENIPGSRMPKDVITDNYDDIVSQLVLFLGDESEEVVKFTLDGLSKIRSLIKRETNDDNENIKRYWTELSLKIMYDFEKIIASSHSEQKITVIRAIIRSLEAIKSLLPMYATKLLLLVDAAIDDPKVKNICFKFYELFVRLGGSVKNVLRDSFCHLVSRLISNIPSYPKETYKILRLLFIEYNDQVSDCFQLIELVPELSLYPEFTDLLLVVKKSIKFRSKVEHATALTKSFKEAPPSFQLLIADQLLIIFNDEKFCFDEFSMKDELGNMILESLLSSKNTQLQIKCARILSLISPLNIKNKSLSKNLDLKKNSVEVVVTAITDYLVPMFNDSSMFAYHLSFSTAIQILLKKIGCSYSETESGPSNWDLFDKKTQSVISKFRKSVYNFSARPYKEIEATTLDLWKVSITSAFLHVNYDKNSPEQSEIDKFIEIDNVLKHAPRLCDLLIPYICYWQRDNVHLHNIFKKDFMAVYESLMDPNDAKNDLSKVIMRYIFSIFEHLQEVKLYPSSDVRSSDSSSKYMYIADDQKLFMASYTCKLFSTALQYLEFIIYGDFGSKQEFTEENKHFMKKIYKELGEEDGYSALKELTATNALTDETLSVTEVNIFNKSRTPKVIKNTGYKYLSKLLASGRYERALIDTISYRSWLQCDKRLDAIIARASVRLQKWDFIPEIMNQTKNILDINVERRQQVLDEADINIAKALYFIETKQFENVADVMEEGTKSVVEQMHIESNTSYERVFPYILNIHIFEEIKDFSKSFRDFQRSARPISIEKFKEKWSKWMKNTNLSVDDYEKIVAVHCSMLKICTFDQEKLNQELSNQWISLSRASRKAGQLFRSQIALNRASSLLIQPCALVESAKICWEKHETNKAIALTKTPLSEESIDFGKLVFLRGKWSAELNDMSPAELCDVYTTAVNMTKSGKAYYALGSVADQRVTSFLSFIEQNQGKKAVRVHITKFCFPNMSTDSITKFFSSQVPLALENYFSCIIVSPQYAYEVIPRILQLFFDVGNVFIMDETTFLPPRDKEIVISEMINVVKKNLSKIQSAVWLNALTQLISRVEQPSRLQEFLFSMIHAALDNYPHASFWHLMSLKNSWNSTRRDKYLSIVEILIAKQSVERREQFLDLNAKFDKITKGLIDLASYSDKYRSIKRVSAEDFSPNLVSAFKDCNILLPLSGTLNVSPGNPSFSDPTKFDNTPVAVEMKSEIRVFNSMQQPKRISILANNGKHYHYLCKKDDDLRKDMRMMEFCSFVNRILSHDSKCRDRSLSMVTFAVICLNECNGILEWSENTSSFREVTVKLYNMHKICIKPKDIGYIIGGLDKRITPEQKKENFTNKVLINIPPVLHEWFFLNFHSPDEWFKRRLQYIRSTAVWSMVGYIVGLGDRHAENLLINTVTGSAVHCDFALLFDKGKTLGIPELVPFRLTQNVVDGMGVLGTKGAFSSCSTHILSALRVKKQKLVSVLQTFVHDPLIEWQVKKSVATNAGSTAIINAVSTAKMVLKGVDQRLSGFSEDKTSFQSPDCVVRMLIKEATDPYNLAQMYTGWMPYL